MYKSAPIGDDKWILKGIEHILCPCMTAKSA